MRYEEKDSELKQLRKKLLSYNYYQGLPLKEIMYHSDFKLLYTAVSKNACTQTKFVLLDLAKYPEKAERSKAPHDVNTLNSVGFQNVFISDDKAQAYDSLFNRNYYRFSLSRNPFDRIVSAFVNKFQENINCTYEESREESINNFWRRQACIIKGILYGKSTSSINLISDPLTFKEFVYYICEQDAYDMDRHWYFQNRAMFLDEVNYDFIGKVENYHKDIKHILNETGQPSDLYNGEQQNANTRTKPYEDYFDSELESIIATRFQEDFEIFKYANHLSKTITSNGDISITQLQKIFEKNNSKKVSETKKILMKDFTVVITVEAYTYLPNIIKGLRFQYGYYLKIIVIVKSEISKSILEILNKYEIDSISLDENEDFLFTNFIKEIHTNFFMLLNDHSLVNKKTCFETISNIFNYDNKIVALSGINKNIYFNEFMNTKLKESREFTNFQLIQDFSRKQILAFPIEKTDTEIFETNDFSYKYCDLSNDSLIIRTEFIANEKIKDMPDLYSRIYTEKRFKIGISESIMYESNYLLNNSRYDETSYEVIKRILTKTEAAQYIDIGAQIVYELEDNVLYQSKFNYNINNLFSDKVVEENTNLSLLMLHTY